MLTNLAIRITLSPYGVLTKSSMTGTHYLLNYNMMFLDALGPENWVLFVNLTPQVWVGMIGKKEDDLE